MRSETITPKDLDYQNPTPPLNSHLLIFSPFASLLNNCAALPSYNHSMIKTLANISVRNVTDRRRKITIDTDMCK